MTFKRFLTQLIPLRKWLLWALVIRLVSAATHSVWLHPDEWFQTVEFANLMARGFMSYTQEVDYHLRNLSWPWLLSWALRLSQWIAPEWIALRVYLVQAASGILDLTILWGVWQTLRAFRWRVEFPAWIQNLALALLVVPFFWVADSIRPSQEHLSAIALWLCLGFLARGRWAVSGFFVVAIAAMKYPAGLMSAGIFAAVWLGAWKQASSRLALRFTLGCALGLLAFGWADWVYYGRPWESLWMYVQYNVLTGLSHLRFGAQGPEQYGFYLKGHWGGVLAPLALGLVPFLLYGVYRGIRRLEPWAWALLFYAGGHLAISHKEPRFLGPIETLLIFGAVAGLAELRPRLRLRSRRTKAVMKAAGIAVAVLLLIANGALFLRALWGETGIAIGTYFELSGHLKRVSQGPEQAPVCAIVTVRRPISSQLPGLDADRIPEPALGFFPVERRKPNFEQTTTRPLIWIEHAPQCEPQTRALLHLHHPDPRWNEQGCKLLPSGILRVIPESSWSQALARGWARGSWYECPSRVLSLFSQPETRRVLAREIPKLSTLPGPGISAEELVSRIPQLSKTRGLQDGTLGDW